MEMYTTTLSGHPTISKCAFCGREMGSRSAEFFYWQSDGCGGSLSACRACVREHERTRRMER